MESTKESGEYSRVEAQKLYAFLQSYFGTHLSRGEKLKKKTKCVKIPQNSSETVIV